MLRSLFRSSLHCLKSRNLNFPANQNIYSYHSTNISVRTNRLFSGICSHFISSEGFKIRTAGSSSNRYMSNSVSSSSVTVTEHGASQAELLTAVEDHFGGVIVELKEPMDSQAFISLLRASMLYWKQQGKKGVWIKLPIELVNLVEATVKEGFWYHHAEHNYLMLVYWIPETANTLPANATHRVGIGAFVMNDQREVLVIQEKNGRLRGTGLWKFPTGVVDEGEDICAAAVREVKEETGIDAEFVEVLAFRQSHKAFFDKSDLFFVCMLRPLSFAIQKQEQEIEAAEWMPIEEYADQPFVQKHELLKYMIDIGLAAVKREYAGFSPVATGSVFSGSQSYLYLNSQDLSKSTNSGNP